MSDAVDRGITVTEIAAMDQPIDVCPETTAAFVVLGVFAWNCASCCAAVIYNNDFEGEISAEWSKASVTVSPAEQRAFLGEFGEEEVSLSR